MLEGMDMRFTLYGKKNDAKKSDKKKQRLKSIIWNNKKYTAKKHHKKTPFQIRSLRPPHRRIITAKKKTTPNNPI